MHLYLLNNVPIAISYSPTTIPFTLSPTCNVLDFACGDGTSSTGSEIYEPFANVGSVSAVASIRPSIP